MDSEKEQKQKQKQMLFCPQNNQRDNVMLVTANGGSRQWNLQKSLANASRWLLAYGYLLSCICLFTRPKKKLADICFNFTTRTAHTHTHTKKYLVHNRNSTFLYFAFSSCAAQCMQWWSWMIVWVYPCAFCCKQFLLLLLLPSFQFDALKGQLLYVILCWLNDELFKTRWQTRVHTLYSLKWIFLCGDFFPSCSFCWYCWCIIYTVYAASDFSDFAILLAYFLYSNDLIRCPFLI